jgi:hypothetical protein
MSDWNEKIVAEFRAGSGKAVGDGLAESETRTDRVIPVVLLDRR